MQSFLTSQSIVCGLSDESSLIQAIFNGDSEEVRSLVLKNEDVNSLDGERRTPLHAAAYLGDVDMINLLVLGGARVNTKDVRWLTPLHRACASRAEDAVAALLKHQADVNVRDKLWQSPLHVAAANDAVGCAELLIPHLTNLNFADRGGRQSLHHAAYNGHVNMVNLLIKHGANIHAYDRQERRAIHWAAYMGNTEVIKVLVSHGADINCRDKRSGNTPMHAAASAGQISAVKMLLEFGFDINTENAQKCTALHLACYNGQDIVVHELLEAGASVNVPNENSCTPLHYAAASTHGALCLELLVNNDADVNVQNDVGKTPLHMTAVHGRFTRSQTLLQCGARVDLVDVDGNSALHVAAKHGHELLVTTLLDAGADPYTKGSLGQLPIHLAALHAHMNCCRKLLAAAASEEKGITHMDVVALTDRDGRSCLHHAACGGALECLDVFLSYVDSPEVITQRDKSGRMPLHYALSSARRECARRLLAGALQKEDFKMDLNSADADGRSLLHHAAATDANGGCVELLVERGIDILATDNAGYTALHYAAAYGHDTVVKLLVNADNNILKATHAPEQEVASPLHLSAYYGHVSVVLYLAEYLIDLDIPDNHGQTPLELAAFQGNAECIRALQMQGACSSQRNIYNNRTALHAAACYGHMKCMKLLLDGAQHDQTLSDQTGINRFLNAKDGDNCTPLMHCVSNGHLTAVDFLLSRNAFLWPVDKFGCTAVHRAAVAGHEDILRNLLHHAAQQQPTRSRFSIAASDTGKLSETEINYISPVVSRSHNGRTALHFAAIRGNASILESLLQVSSTVNVIDRYGYTPLHYACLEGHEPCVDALLLHDSFCKFEGSPFSPLHCAVFNDNEACADRLIETLGNDIVNMKDKQGRTPLHACVLGDYVDSAHFLIAHNAKIDSADKSGKTPLMVAAQKSNESCLEILLKSKSNYALTDCDENNALHLACLNECSSTAHLLIDVIEEPSVLNAQNKYGQTALHISAKKGMTDVVMELIEHNCDINIYDNAGLSPALACAPNEDVADCLDLIISMMLKYVQSKGRITEVDFASMRRSMESCQLSTDSAPCSRRRLSSAFFTPKSVRVSQGDDDAQRLSTIESPFIATVRRQSSSSDIDWNKMTKTENQDDNDSDSETY